MSKKLNPARQTQGKIKLKQHEAPTLVSCMPFILRIILDTCDYSDFFKPSVGIKAFQLHQTKIESTQKGILEYSIIVFAVAAASNFAVFSKFFDQSHYARMDQALQEAKFLLAEFIHPIEERLERAKKKKVRDKLAKQRDITQEELERAEENTVVARVEKRTNFHVADHLVSSTMLFATNQSTSTSLYDMVHKRYKRVCIPLYIGITNTF